MMKQFFPKKPAQFMQEFEGVEVYYWAPSIKNLQVGHLSLRFRDDEGEIYISHWPKGQNVSLSSDIEDEGRYPTENLLIQYDMISMGKMRQWWTQFLNAGKGTENYNLLVNNCAQVVYRALRAGNFPHYFVLTTPLFTPYEVKEWVKDHIVTFRNN